MIGIERVWRCRGNAKLTMCGSQGKLKASNQTTVATSLKLLIE